jgi:zinc transport system substrate-binding protein
MSSKRLALSVVPGLFAFCAQADVPSVAVDIAPVHSLVSMVMDGVGTPDLILPAGASPHEYSLRPSEASAIQDADLVIWIGEDLSPWLGSAVSNLAGDAVVRTLLEADGTVLLAFREGASFEGHDHGHDDHDHEHEEEHAHDDHDHDHAHDEEHAHDDHGHSHGEFDPHAWLSPTNAANWLNVIAADLSALDPENAGTYFANAAAAREALAALTAEVNEILDPVRGGSFVAFHDAYQYFEREFDFPAAGAIALGDAAEPSPARIAQIQTRIQEENVGCVLAEPQYNPGMVATVMQGTEANTGVIDPLGVDLDVGPTLYPDLIRNMARTLADCL